MFERVRRDCRRYMLLESETGRPRWLERLRILLDSPGLHAVLIYRLGAWINRTIPHKLLRLPFKLVYVLLDRLCTIAWGIHIDDGADIGGGLYIAHPGAILIGPVRMGEDCNIAHQVTVGRRADVATGVPTLGDRVWIGTGSVVFGGIRIGNGVSIGPLTVVARSLPDRVLVMGNPMRVLRRPYDNSAEIYGIHRELWSDVPPPATETRLSKRKMAAAVLRTSGAVALMRTGRRMWRDEIPILAYHRVLDIAGDPEFDFDPELVSASVEDFDWQMRYIQRHYTPITFSHLLSALDGVGTLPARPIIVTFDDGFDDNYRNAFPVLKSLGVPATFFIATGYIGQSRTFWFDWFFYLCGEAKRRGVSVRIDSTEFNFADEQGDASRRAALAQLWVVPDGERRAAIRRLEAALALDQPEDGFSRSRPMMWEDVQEMAAHGMEIGSHTVSHPILTTVDDDGLYDELGKSKQDLEQRLRRPVDVIAYPVGGPQAFNGRVQRAVRDAGYRLGVSYVSGTNERRRLDRFALKRLHVERYIDRAQFSAALALPEVFG